MRLELTSLTEISPKEIADDVHATMKHTDLGENPWEELKRRVAAEIVSRTLLNQDPENEQITNERYLKYSTRSASDY